MYKLSAITLGMLLSINSAYAFDEPLSDEEPMDELVEIEVDDSTAIVLDEPLETDEKLVLDQVDDSETFVEDRYEEWLSTPLGQAFEEMTENNDGVNYAQMQFGLATSRSSNMSMKTIRRTFEQAFENAVEKIALESRAALASDRISTLAESTPKFDDYICPANASARDKLIQQKVTQLAEVAFIEKLSAQGTSQENIEKALKESSVQDKKNILEDSLKNDINVETGWRGISSFFVQKVFMAVQEDGAVSVGVVIVKTTPAHEMIQYVTKSKGDFDPNAWKLPQTFKPISQTFKDEDGEYKKFASTSEYARYLINQKQDETVLGAHLVYDNNGYPTIVAVSYESVDKRSSNSAEMRTYKKIAKKRATTYAMNELYRLVGLKAKVNIEVIDSVSLTKKAVANYLDCSLDNIDVEDTQINSTTDTKVTIHSKVEKLSLKGVKTKNGTFYNPFNPKQISYYSYAIWSPLQDAKQRRMENSTGAFKRKSVESTSNSKGISKQATQNQDSVKHTESQDLLNATF